MHVYCLGSQKHACLRSQKHACLGSQKHACLGSQKHSCLGSQKHACLGSQKHACLGSQKRRYVLSSPRVWIRNYSMSSVVTICPHFLILKIPCYYIPQKNTPSMYMYSRVGQFFRIRNYSVW